MKMKIIFILLLILAVNLDATTHSNIIFFSPVPRPSHNTFNKALAEALALRGHNVTFVSAETSNKVIQNFHYVHLERVYGHYQDEIGHHNYHDSSRKSSFQHILTFHKFSKNICEGVKLSRGTRVIKKYPKNFKIDLVISDYVYGPCLLGFLPKFNYPPVIGVSAVNNPPFTIDILGGDKLGMTVKPFYLLDYDEQLSFFQRLRNGFINFFDSFYRKRFTIPAMDKMMRDIFGPELPYATELEKQTSIVLVNSHPVVDFSELLPQNVIQVGGLQINEPKTVPQAINDFIMAGSRGAILMSLGRNIKIDEIGQDFIMDIFQVFRHMPDYNFLWKFETHKVLKDMPKNVMVKHVLPQNDILAHPHVKAFITHGGFLSTHEAVWHSVPMVVVPFSANQHRNSVRSVHSGIAYKIDFHSFSSEKFKKALLEVLHNPKYKRNIQQKSKIFKDQPEKPLERAIWWCEFVMRHPTAVHLKPKQYSFGLLGEHYWDIKMMMILSFLLTIWSFYKFLKYLFVKQIVIVVPEMTPAKKFEMTLAKQKVRKFE